MRIVLGRAAMRRPARMADTDRALERLARSLASRFFSLPSARRRVSTPPSSVATPGQS